MTSGSLKQTKSNNKYKANHKKSCFAPKCCKQLIFLFLFVQNSCCKTRTNVVRHDTHVVTYLFRLHQNKNWEQYFLSAIVWLDVKCIGMSLSGRKGNVNIRWTKQNIADYLGPFLFPIKLGQRKEEETDVSKLSQNTYEVNIHLSVLRKKIKCNKGMIWYCNFLNQYEQCTHFITSEAVYKTSTSVNFQLYVRNTVSTYLTMQKPSE